MKQQLLTITPLDGVSENEFSYYQFLAQKHLSSRDLNDLDVSAAAFCIEREYWGKFNLAVTNGIASVSGILPGELVLQSAPEVRQHVDLHGNWSRETFATITDKALNHAIESYNAVVDAHIHHLKIRQHSTEEITGIKLIEALGAIKLVSGGALHIGATGEIKVVSANDHKTKAAGNLELRIGKIMDSLAVEKQLIKVKNGGKVWLGSEGENVLKILSELIQVVSDVANIAKDHTHKYTDNGSPMTTQKPDQSGDFGGKKGEADGLKGRLDPVVE